MRVWIDQDCCTGAGLCVDRCPEMFIVLDDGIGYVRDGVVSVTDPDAPSVHVALRYERSVVDAVEHCPGECIYVETDGVGPVIDDESDIVDAEVITDR